ncbi:hypothetical protein WME73_47450 [Sorangium sp. So ce302]|uniref:hypothetical protein n=1 Tax=unclassified Sorangium TaxID=2621164 RepID=UPI003F60CF5E
MGRPAEEQRRATYADLGAVPPNKEAELVGGTLHVLPRPAPRRWGPAAVYRDAARVRVVPFEAIELDLSVLWAE